MAVVTPRDTAAPGPAAQPSWRARLERRVRSLPIRWRIFAIAALNTMVVVLLAALIWDGARVVSMAWTDLRQARQTDEVLVALESETVRLQSLIHRYFNQPQPAVLADIEARRADLLEALEDQRTQPVLARSMASLIDLTERFLAGFDKLRVIRTDISRVYEHEVLRAARDMSGLYASIEGATKDRGAPIWPALGRSREAFSATLMAANAFYLSLASEAADDAYKQIASIEQGIPTLLDLADNDQQKEALQTLGERAGALRSGLNNLAKDFAAQALLLQEAIDGNQSAMAGIIEQLSAEVRADEQAAQRRFDHALNDVYWQLALVAFAFLVLIIVIGVAIVSSIQTPLNEVKNAMNSIVAGDYDRPVRGLEARDEMGEMARSVEVFRENALARRRAEQELRASKERAESTLADLRETQKSLIEAEKLAALGSLVAGVAHEVNNPVGISLTVASSLARRCETFATEIKEGQLRRSRLDEFLAGSREAAKQLVSNLERAGELIQSFKQVAVDRSHEERRQFDLRLSTNQIVASLRPGLRRAQLELVTELQDGVILDSYPGAYGQVLTNLMLNAVNHGFADGRHGTIRIETRRSGSGHAEIIFSDNGAGMSEEVQRRAFDPFFTTRRSQGGTGLGLHIVYNIVTRRLGGRIGLTSAPGRGTTFRIALPLSAPRKDPQAVEIMTITDR